MKEVIIIGAGPAGLSAAYELSKNNIKVTVLESSNSIGGLSKSIDIWGQTVDLGPHRFFTKDKRINKFFHEILGDRYTNVNRKTRIYYNKRLFEYPLKFLNVISNISLIKIFKVVFYFGIQKISPKKDTSTFDKWIINRFGKELFKMFFKNYTEKLWGIPCNKIDSDWAAQRIKKLTLFQAIIHSIFSDNKQKHKTLVDEFMYPKGGTGQLYIETGKKIIENGGTILLDHNVERIILSDDFKKAIGVELFTGERMYADNIISTMPLTLMVSKLPSVTAKVTNTVNSLYFRNTILVYLEIDNSNVFDDNWLYIHSNDVLHGRITNFRNWCPSINNGKDTTILCLEFWCFEKDEIWSYDNKKLIDIASEEIRTINLLKKKDGIINGKVIKIPKSYPVYEIGYSNSIDIIKTYLN
ncbi:MAG: FAD-dependent oxidoreductase, partial [Flavobacteriaceae bacterium]|nr:FAD-dependent oxidoreductase [Flavobacteriaceae bacterium]